MNTPIPQGKYLETPTDIKTYTYATTGWKDQLLSYGNESFEYYSLGNPTTYRDHALVWGKIRQLEHFDSHEFTYNARGIRTSKDNITYELDGSRILTETRRIDEDTRITTRYYYGSNGICGFKYNGSMYYYEKNVQGDITHVYDELGNLKA